MTKYREILRLKSLGISNTRIADSIPCSRNTVSSTWNRAAEHGITWETVRNMTDAEVEQLLFVKQEEPPSDRVQPDFAYIRKELKKPGVTKKLLWTEYLEQCRLSGGVPLMYSQFCYWCQQDEIKHKATMHIDRNPGEKVEVDWAGDPAHLIDPNTGEIVKAWVFVGVMSYSQYPYVEAFLNEKQEAWITAHVHMFQWFGGCPRIIVPDNCKTAVIHDNNWYTPALNTTYHEMAEHYNVAIIPARVRRPKDKPGAEGTVGDISTWIIAALRNEQFFSLAELNQAIHEKLEQFVNAPFTKKDGTRRQLFLEDEQALLSPLPSAPFEMATWKEATVQFNYHVYLDGMYYSVPHEYIGKKVSLRATSTVVEVFYNNARIASHPRHYGRKGQYHTATEHMPKEHQDYLEWNGERFRKWAIRIGPSVGKVIEGMLTAQRVEQQAYRSCMGLLKLSQKYSPSRLESACAKALSFSSSPSFKSVKNILAASAGDETENTAEEKPNTYALTRGADYYKGR